MSKGLFIVGTDTDVGKTFITAGITYILRKNGYKAISFKPIQSGGILKDNKLISGDVAFVRQVADIREEDVVMNSYCLKEAVSPHIAAEKEKVEIHVDKIIDDYQRLKASYDYVIVEGAGGIVVPLIRERYYIYDLIQELNIPVLIVARAGVGTINHTALTAAYLKGRGIEIRGCIINQYGGSYFEKDNIEVIQKITGLKVFGMVDKLDIKEAGSSILEIRQGLERNLRIDNLMSLF